METESVTLKLPRNLLSGAQDVAAARDVTIGHMVRQLLRREVDRQLGAEPRHENGDTRVTAALEVLLARDVALAQDWNDLQERLHAHGYDLQKAADGLTLNGLASGSCICDAKKIGISYPELADRFGCPLPAQTPGYVSFGTMPAGQIDPTRKNLLTTHFDAAKSWPDLVNRLACEGMEIRLLGHAVGIYISATGRHLCNSETLGADYDTMVSRFGAGMTGLASNAITNAGIQRQ